MTIRKMVALRFVPGGLTALVLGGLAGGAGTNAAAGPSVPIGGEPVMAIIHHFQRTPDVDRVAATLPRPLPLVGGPTAAAILIALHGEIVAEAAGHLARRCLVWMEATGTDGRRVRIDATRVCLPAARGGLTADDPAYWIGRAIPVDRVEHRP